MNRQIRVNVSGVFQFAFTVDQAEEMSVVADRCRKTMRLSENYTVRVTPGQINFVPGGVR